MGFEFEHIDKLKLARRIFFDNEQGYQKMCKLVQNEPDRKETPAQFQERCTQIALDFIWKKEKVESNGHTDVFRRENLPVKKLDFDNYQTLAN